MREMHMLNKAVLMVGVLILTPFLIWIVNRKDKKKQDMEDDAILQDKDGLMPKALDQDDD